jgi:hypothetical protein
MAVTYYNQTVLGGTSYPRYADPLVTGKSNADGLYPWSTVRARLASYNGSVVDATYDTGAGGQNINILLFSSDIPAAGYIAPAATSIPAGTLAPTASVSTISSGGANAFFRATPGGAVVTVAAGQVGVGYSYNAAATTTADQNIYVAGFPAAAVVGSVDSAELWAWSNSPNISSPVSFQNWDAQAGLTTEAERLASGALPIVLLYTSYTQAIRDAGNIIVNTAAPIGSTYQVVGLWAFDKGL